MGRRCGLMEDYVELTKEYLNKRRNMSRKVFYLMGRVYRGVNNNRFTWEYVYGKLFGRENINGL